MYKNNLNIYKYIVESLKPYTSENMEKRQIGLSLEKTINEWNNTTYYTYKGRKENIFNGKCVVIYNFPVSNIYNTFKLTLNDAVRHNFIIKPVLIFVNNRHISWDDIEVISGNSLYLYFKDIEDEIKTLQIYELNFDVEIVNGRYIGKRPFISFNEDGTYSTKSNLNSINYVVSESQPFEEIIVKKSNIKDGIVKNIIDSEYRIFRNSLILFDNNGNLCDDYNDLININIFNTLRTRKFDGMYLFVYNKNMNTSQNNNISNHFANKEYWENYLANNSMYDVTNIGFNLNENNNLDDEEYYKDCLTQILKYNYNLVMDVFNHYFNWTTKYTFKVSELKKDEKRILNIHKRHMDNSTSNILVYVNGLLISKNNENYIINLNNLSFNFKKMKDSDEVTILYYKKSENRFINIELSDIDSTIIDPSFDISNSRMFSRYIKDHKFGIVNNDKVIYEIPFKYTKINEGEYIITPEDKSYYNTTVTLSSINQFRHYSFFAKEHLVKIILPNEFITCNEFYKYQLFVNGRRISQYDMKITYPTKTTPFKEVMLYLKHPINKGDLVDVIYTPIENKEVVFIENINSNIIEIDKNKLEFPLDSRLYSFYINGEMIDSKKIIYISNNKIVIEPSIINSKYNLSIVSLTRNDNFMKDIFINNDDIISQIVNNIPNDELEKLTKINEEVNFNDDNYNADNFKNKSVIFEIIKDHWVSNGLYQGVPTYYDYEKDESMNEFDVGGNLIFDILDAKSGGKIDC